MKLIILILALCFSRAPAISEDLSSSPTDNTIVSADICANEESDKQIYCSCDRVSVGEALLQCWILGSNLTQDYGYWKHFLNQPHVKSLRMTVKPTGNLTFLPQRTLTHLRELQKFEIIYATVDDIPSHTFANMSALTQLKLDNNQIVSIASKAFVHLPNLTEMNLDDNRIRELRRGVFLDVPKLQKLFITKNNIAIIHDGAFEHLPSLLELELATNEISVLTKETFKGLASLKRLDLSFNKVEMLGHHTFSEMPMLEELLLENNNIKLITEKAFSGLGNLQKLKLNKNKITSLPSMVFKDLHNLFDLDLVSNFLETITLETIQPIMHNLLNSTSYFLVEVNQFTCDCRLAWTHRLHDQTQNVLIRKQLEDMLCRLNQPETEHQDDASKATTMLPTMKSADMGTQSQASPDSGDVEYEYEYYDDLQETSSTRRFLQIPPSELYCTWDQRTSLAPEEMRLFTTVQTDSASHSMAMHPNLAIIVVIACAISRWL